MVKVDARLGELFGQLGISTQSIEAQARGLSGQRLAKLENSYAQALGSTKWLQDLKPSSPSMVPFGYVPSPDEVKARLSAMVGGLYGGGGDVFAPHPSVDHPLQLAFTRRRQAMVMNRRIEQDASFRERLGPHLGGQVVAHGRYDGGVTVQRMRSHGAGSGWAPGAPSGNPYAGGSTVWDLFMQMDAAVLGQASSMGSYESGVGWLNIYGDADGWGGSGYESPGYNAFGMSMASNTSRSNPLDRLIDPNLALQNASRIPSTSLTGPAVGVQSPNPDSTSDTATLRLERLMRKRSEMYDLYKNIWSKYNESAKTAIDNLRA